MTLVLHIIWAEETVSHPDWSPPMELLVKKGCRENLIGGGGDETKKKRRVDLLLGGKTLYQHWGQFTPQFSGAINRPV